MLLLCIYCYVDHCASVEKSGFHHEIPDNKEVLHDECYYRGGGGDNVFVCRHVPPPATSRDCHEVMRHDHTSAVNDLSEKLYNHGEGPY